MILNLSSRVFTVDSCLRRNDGRLCKGLLLRIRSKDYCEVTGKDHSYDCAAKYPAGMSKAGVMISHY